MFELALVRGSLQPLGLVVNEGVDAAQRCVNGHQRPSSGKPRIGVDNGFPAGLPTSVADHTQGPTPGLVVALAGIELMGMPDRQR